MKISKIHKCILLISLWLLPLVVTAQTPYDSFAPEATRPMIFTPAERWMQKVLSDSMAYTIAVDTYSRTLYLINEQTDSLVAIAHIDQKDVLWLSVDPLADKYIDNSPYVYCSGNPIMLVDPSGMDEEQREAGKKMGEQYIKMNPNKSEVFYELGKKGGPGQKVDCSGLVSRCIVAGEEEDPSKKGVGNGVRRIANNTQKIEDMNDIMVGNLVTFYGEANGEYSHIGYITDVILDDNGNVADFLFIHAAKSTGPTINGYKESSYWRKRVSGFYKWDTHPDVYNGLPLPPIIVFGKMPERPILTRALHVIP